MSTMVKILEILSDEDIQWLLSMGMEEQLEPEAVLIREGEFTEAVYIVLEGLLGVFVSAGGYKQVAAIGAGEIIGEMSYLENEPTSATVIAVEPSIVLSISKDAIDDRISADPTFGNRLYRGIGVAISQRLRRTMGRIEFMLMQLEIAKKYPAESPD
ncbi:Crp/Fnr family transcriptional regulator [Candidatus Magnetominusculus xianensis]|uniref:Cyclic nucleotide-binding protein n=1 Tax=Candidatus Magnetominusculus xianensis TaxID=1748249 RepID=A0ABR5SDH7_9BACT|nr:cyclic nucleotide-binding domain-containing protein [Candidatus Magnetominusculus xianensis]KWT83001.1 cyclic nucleotide-binding protein [Candidatus Magnetominusculus xianensis]MBF0402711.1 cyclic nucleotide-binding domain-containing protein [Nitrospirota bacterium]